MRYDPKAIGYSIVFLGNFNPKILNPAWLKMQDVISASEFENSEIEIVHPELVKFNAGSIKIEATLNRFICSTTTDPYARIYDFVMQLFGQHLPHAPASAVGINFEIHFSVEDPARRIALGRALAPLAPWGKFGSRIKEQTGGEPGGIVSITMRELINADSPHVRNDVTVEPSKLFVDSTTVFVRSNYHIQLKRHISADEYQGEHGIKPILEILTENFEAGIREGKDTVSELMEFTAKLDTK